MIVTISILDENLEQEKAVDIEEKKEEVPLIGTCMYMYMYMWGNQWLLFPFYHITFQFVYMYILIYL